MATVMSTYAHLYSQYYDMVNGYTECSSMYMYTVYR